MSAEFDLTAIMMTIKPMWDGIFLSALARIQREKDNLGPVNSQSKVRYKNQKVPMTALKQTSYF